MLISSTQNRLHGQESPTMLQSQESFHFHPGFPKSIPFSLMSSLCQSKVKRERETRRQSKDKTKSFLKFKLCRWIQKVVLEIKSLGLRSQGTDVFLLLSSYTDWSTTLRTYSSRNGRREILGLHTRCFALCNQMVSKENITNRVISMVFPVTSSNSGCLIRRTSLNLSLKKRGTLTKNSIPKASMSLCSQLGKFV